MPTYSPYVQERWELVECRAVEAALDAEARAVSSGRRTTSASRRAASSAVARVAKRTVLSVSSRVNAAARSAAALVKTPPLKKMTKELSYATNRTFKRVPARADSVVVSESGTSQRYAGYHGGGKGGGSPGGFSPGTARTVALTASAIRARNYAAAARAAFCGTAAHMGESKTQKVDLAAIGHGALDLLGFIPGIGAAADVANGLWYAAEGNYVDAAMSFVSAVPGVGDAAGAAKVGAKAGLAALDAADAALAASRAAKKVASPSQMTAALKSAKSKVKREIKRFEYDKSVRDFETGEERVPHVHFTDDTAMRSDGVVHDESRGIPRPSKETSEFLEKGGWAGGPIE